jgi:nucleoside-diphosphate-sugar epimerase
MTIHHVARERRGMNIALTGATGFIGSHVLTELRQHGHDVTALVRGEPQAAALAARGATPVVLDLYDSDAVAEVLTSCDAAIHTASPGDATSADLDSAVVEAAIGAFAGTSKPYAHISGLWIYGRNASINEDSPLDPPPFVAWKLPIQARLLYADEIRGIMVVAGTAYGDGSGGIPALLLNSPRDDAGNLIMLGSGQQHWSTVHVADLADVFRRAVEHESADGCYIIEDGSHPRVSELTEAAAVAAGAPGAVPGCAEEARARLGGDFAEVLLLDQASNATRARTALGWRSTRPTLIEEFRNGSYRPGVTESA